jgi:iron complex outermembrane receptor protein
MKQLLSLKHLVPLLICLLPIVSQASDTDNARGSIRGKILTEDNQPAENVSVMLKGTKYGTITDENGEFLLRAPVGNYTLIVSFTGFKTQETAIVVKDGKPFDVPVITLHPITNSLSGVNITGSKANKFSNKRSNDVAKMPLDNLENPQVYSTITSTLLTEQQVLTLDDALKNSAGLQTMWNATGRSGDGGSYYNSRGFILQSTLRNGLAGLQTNTTDAVNIDRIEVLKGPSATLFGSTLTSFGGTINRVTKRPYDDFGGSVTYTVGSYDLNRLSADFNTPVDPAKKLLFRLNTAVNYAGSFQNNGFSRSAAIDPSLLYKVNDKLSISFDAELNYGKNSAKPIFFFWGNVSTLGTNRADRLDLDYRQTYSNDNLDQNSHSNNYYARVNYRISSQWNWQTDFSYSSSFSNGFYPYFYLMAKDTISRNDQSTKNSTYSILEVQQNFNGDFSIGSMRNRFVGGLDYFHQNSNQLFFGGYFDNVATTLGKNGYGNFNYQNLQAIYNTPGGIVFNYPDIFKKDTYSAYAADELNITDQLLALAALRVDHYENKGSNIGGTITAPYSQTAWSPKFGLVYQLVEKQVSLFANYQNGFINPGTYLSFDNSADNFVTKIAKVQNARQVEGGVKLDLFDGKLSSTVSYYNIQLTNVLRTDAAHTAQYAQLQDGTQLSRGVEAEVIANPAKGLNIIGGLAYNDSKYTQGDADVLGRRPNTAASPFTANIYASYRLPKTVVNGLGFGLGGNYASNNKIINSVSQGVFILPAYTIFNASAFYEQPRYRINLAVNNFTNKEYWIGYTTLNPQMLRQLSLSMTYKF